MKPDYSCDSLFKPGLANDFFTLPNPKPLIAGANQFLSSNAWWLAEISRLIYHVEFYKNKNINLGSFNYDVLGYISNHHTSTEFALLKVNPDNPILVIVFRGTDEADDWNTNFHAYQMPFGKAGKVHHGFIQAYLSIREDLFEYLKDNNLPIFITGHSLGAALAVLATSELSNNKNFDSCYTFGSPRIGDPEFIDTIDNKRIYRIVNNCDVVTTVPIDFVGIKYRHIGLPYLINDKGALLENMSDEEIYRYQKGKRGEIKDYAISKIFNNDLKSIKADLPVFLADHAPINYVSSLQKL